MGRSQRLDRAEHFFGDMYSRSELNRICFERYDKKQDPKELDDICRGILELYGYENAAVMSGGRCEYEIRYQ